MRLINTTTLEPQEFFAEFVPPYAILSHRWDSTEVTYQDLSEGRGPHVEGWAKVAGCCAKAASDGFEYAWIDSCCIDKTSSAELSEAINSMFNWYQHAQVCYAYVSDVASARQDPSDPESDFQKSKWFTRGWTLQELLAPASVEFFDRNWIEIGTKASLQKEISKITRISVEHLFDRRHASVAQKMSWASRRITTRPEDEAYCLLGLFDVSMPPLYGEGTKAFLRLQLQILNQTDDDSLFAWELIGEHTNRDIHHDMQMPERSVTNNSLLANGVKSFRNSGQVSCVQQSYLLKPWLCRPPVVTNMGLAIIFPTITSMKLCRMHQVFILLKCSFVKEGDAAGFGGLIGLQITKLKDGHWRRMTQKLWVVPFSHLAHAPTQTWNCSLSALFNFFNHVNLEDQSAGAPDSLLRLTHEHTPMYFPLIGDLESSGTKLDLPESLTIKLSPLITNGFSLAYVYIAPIDERCLPNIQGEGTYWSGSDKSGHKAELALGNSIVLAFLYKKHRSFCLTVTHTTLVTSLGLITLGSDLAPYKFIKALLGRASNAYGLPLPDRVSLKIEDGIFVSASLKRMQIGSGKKIIYQVVLSVDDYPKWNASQGS